MYSATDTAKAHTPEEGGRKMSQGKSKKVIAAGLLVMSLTMACNSALAPILAEVGKFFPDASDSAIQIVLTLINLVTLPAMILEPFLESKITKRDIAMIGTFLMLAGALLPQVLSSQLWMLYLSSIIIGVGLSFVVVTSSSLISDYFTGLEKSRIMGFQSIFVSIGGTIIAKGSGLLTAMAGWKRGYLVFLIALPIIHGSQGRNHSKGGKRKRKRNFRQYGLFWHSVPDYRDFCRNLQHKHCHVSGPQGNR